MIEVSPIGERISQGDIFRDLSVIEHVAESGEVVELTRIIFPFCIVLTQDCDLAQDHRFRQEGQKTDDKMLFSILVAPLYNIEHVYSGEHLSELGMAMQKIPKNKTAGGNLVHNETPRYHYLEFPRSVPIPSSVVDFKHFFSMSRRYLEELKSSHRICRLADLYREDLSQRFAWFLSRIGLPDG